MQAIDEADQRRLVHGRRARCGHGKSIRSDHGGHYLAAKAVPPGLIQVSLCLRDACPLVQQPGPRDKAWPQSGPLEPGAQEHELRLPQFHLPGAGDGTEAATSAADARLIAHLQCENPKGCCDASGSYDQCLNGAHKITPVPGTTQWLRGCSAWPHEPYPLR
jgi:hypothetical protein